MNNAAISALSPSPPEDGGAHFHPDNAPKSEDVPLSRWELKTNTGGYAENILNKISTGEDYTGEARLAHALAPAPAAKILDAGSGVGRIGGTLRTMGHHSYGVDLDAELISKSRELYPEFPVCKQRLESLRSADLVAEGFPAKFDLITVVGNVLILVSEGGQVPVLRSLAQLLADNGRIMVGFSTVGLPGNSLVYPPKDFAQDVEAAGLIIDAQFSSYDLRPFQRGDEFLVALLRLPPTPKTLKDGTAVMGIKIRG